MNETDFCVLPFWMIASVGRERNGHLTTKQGLFYCKMTPPPLHAAHCAQEKEKWIHLAMEHIYDASTFLCYPGVIANGRGGVGDGLVEEAAQWQPRGDRNGFITMLLKNSTVTLLPLNEL